MPHREHFKHVAADSVVDVILGPAKEHAAGATLDAGLKLIERRKLLPPLHRNRPTVDVAVRQLAS